MVIGRARSVAGCVLAVARHVPRVKTDSRRAACVYESIARHRAPTSHAYLTDVSMYVAPKEVIYSMHRIYNLLDSTSEAHLEGGGGGRAGPITPPWATDRRRHITPAWARFIKYLTIYHKIILILS